MKSSITGCLPIAFAFFTEVRSILEKVFEYTKKLEITKK